MNDRGPDIPGLWPLTLADGERVETAAAGGTTGALDPWAAQAPPVGITDFGEHAFEVTVTAWGGQEALGVPPPSLCQVLPPQVSVGKTDELSTAYQHPYPRDHIFKGKKANIWTNSEVH